MDYLNGKGGIVEALNAKVYGNGTETLVLSHGFGADQTVWHYILPYLACYFKVVVFDMVFSANVNPQLYNPHRYSKFDSYAEDLICLLDQLNVTKSIYLGHSMSAMIGCIAATHRPHLFKHLILLGGSPRYLNSKGYFGGLDRSDAEMIFKSIKQDYPEWVKDLSTKAVGVSDTASIHEFEYSLGRMKPNITLHVAKTVFLSDLRWVLRHVKIPCTIIQSERDFVVPIWVADYMKCKLGDDTKVEILKTEGHLPQLTAYPLLLNVLKRVLYIN
ncbi:strigolactone esterase D14-like [Macadamia integrifolia]|uniref:strigolactone esterase D14-like n=1 Tax=Macadamia integrifolia TaxID=60698 RepID=UPI001C4FA305|nr:strigolactone esterase D14-like [Macadamia integrifolia]